MRSRIGTVRKFHCAACHHVFDAFCRSAELPDILPCLRCGEDAKLVESEGRLYHKPFTPYYHHGLDRFFQTRSDENRYAKKSGLVNISGDYRERLSERPSPKDFARSRYIKKKQAQLR